MPDAEAEAAPPHPAAAVDRGAFGARAAWATVLGLMVLLGMALWSMKRSAAPDPAAAVYRLPWSQAPAPVAAPALTAVAPVAPVAPLKPLPYALPPTVVPNLPVARLMPATPAPARARVAPVRRPPKPIVIEAPVAISPRQACEGRVGFVLYQCMQLQCAGPKWADHGQCVRLRRSDAVD